MAQRRQPTCVLARLERLACDFDLTDNYFAWQAFSRALCDDRPGPLPPYLQADTFAAIRDAPTGCASCCTRSPSTWPRSRRRRLDRYVLLDAQDWMSDEELTRLWQQITRTARPGARVIFRTAAEAAMLPGRVPDKPAGALALRRPIAPRRSAPATARRSTAASISMCCRAGSVTDQIARPAHGRHLPLSAVHLRSDHAEYYLLGRDRLIAELAPPPGRFRAGDRLRHGAQPHPGGRASIPSARLYGFDLSSLMLRDRAAAWPRRGLAHRIRLGFGDATGFDAQELFAVAAFDRIFISYTLSMIPHWHGALRHALRAACAARLPARRRLRRLRAPAAGLQARPRGLAATLLGDAENCARTGIARLGARPRVPAEYRLPIPRLRDLRGPPKSGPLPRQR